MDRHTKYTPEQLIEIIAAVGKPCPECDGTGEYCRIPYKDKIIIVACKTCQGKGRC